MIEIMILAVSILNLILLIINIYLLRRGYGLPGQVQIVVVEKGEQRILGGERVGHRVVTLGRYGLLQYFNGAGESVTRLQIEELADCAGDVADVYVVPRGHKGA